MKSFLVLSISLFSAFSLRAQVNNELKKELDSMLVLDQKYRELMSMDMSLKGDSISRIYNVPKENLVNHLWALQSKIDSSNIIRVEAIIKQYGYPGKSLVGNPSNEVAFYIIQHSSKIDQYLPLLKAAAEKEELKFSLYAMMLDRSLMNKGSEQIYGTQGRGLQVKDPNTGKTEFKMIIWPIADPASVNKRRKEAGFTQTVEENAARMRIEYKVYTVDEVMKMQEGNRTNLSDEATVRMLEEAERKAIFDGDTVALARLISESILVHNPENTIVGYSQIINRIKEGKISYKRFERNIEKLSVQGNLAIVMGFEIIEPKGEAKNSGYIVRRRFTNIWVKDEKGWKLSARQATIISIEK